MSSTSTPDAPVLWLVAILPRACEKLSSQSVKGNVKGEEEEKEKKKKENEEAKTNEDKKEHQEEKQEDQERQQRTQLRRQWRWLYFTTLAKPSPAAKRTPWGCWQKALQIHTLKLHGNYTSMIIFRQPTICIRSADIMHSMKYVTNCTTISTYAGFLAFQFWLSRNDASAVL